MSVCAPVPTDVPTGWECPRCHRVYSPQTGQCLPCSPPPALFTGTLPRPEPRPFPHPVGLAAEPDAAHGTLLPGPLLRLPPLMESPGFAWRARIGGRWREVVPGFQARRLTVSHDDTLGAAADIEFRLTPAEDGRDDA